MHNTVWKTSCDLLYNGTVIDLRYRPEKSRLIALAFSMSCENSVFSGLSCVSSMKVSEMVDRSGTVHEYRTVW